MVATKYFQRSILIIFCFLSLSSYAKQTLDISLAGYYECSRLARVSDTTSNFSLTSNAGWRGALTIDKYFTNWWVLSLAGNYASHNYVGSAARIINDSQPSLAGGEGGFKFVFGDFRFYMLYNYQPLIILVDEAVYIHDLKQVGMGSGILGFEFSAISRYWDLAFEAKGGVGLSEVDYEGTAVKHQYMVEGSAMIIFGRTNKTLFEVISLKNIIGNDSLFGFKVSVREDSYSFGDDKYTLTNFRAGAFLKFIF